MKHVFLGLLISGVSYGKTAIVCSPGKDAEKYLNGLLNEDNLIYTVKVVDKDDFLDKGTAKYKEEIRVIKPKHVSAPAVTADKICVTVTE